MSPHLPITPQQIAQQAIEAVEAGAAVVHLHARDPSDGRPTPAPEVFKEFVPLIAERTNAVVNITTGGSLYMTLADRLAYPLQAKPELCSLNMGSMNFSFQKAARRSGPWRFDWEKPYLEATEDVIFRNTFRDIKHILHHLGDECGTRFELECYDLGHLYNLAYFVDERLIKPPFFIQTIFGIQGGMGADPENLVLMRTTADRLFGRNQYEMSAFGAGRHQMPIITMNAILGGHVRVGLEDSLYLAKGRLAQSNAEQVRKIRRIVDELSLEIASPDEARAMLGLKGAKATSIGASSAV
jgi:uncharacterized protein (DUF849 family)